MQKTLCFVVVLVVWLGLESGLAQAEKAVSEFTSTAPSKSKLAGEGEDSATYICEGLGGYEIIFEQSHGRSWINVVWAGEVFDLMDITLNAAPGNWPVKANDVLQWRGYMLDGQFSPYALIYRMRSMKDDVTPVETFIIIRLAQGATAMVGSLPASKGNAAAEALADQLCAE